MKTIETCAWCGLEIAFEETERLVTRCPRCENFIARAPESNQSTVVLRGDAPIGEIHLAAGSHTLGRRSDRSRASVQLPVADMYMSKCHAAVDVSFSAGMLRAIVSDAGSSNGTFVNEQRLAPGQRRQLVHGDRLRIGATTLVVSISHVNSFSPPNGL